MTEEELREIERKLSYDYNINDIDADYTSKDDVRRLIAEVRRLQQFEPTEPLSIDDSRRMLANMPIAAKP